MQTAEMTLKIEILGNLIEELAYWNSIADNEEIEYADDKFIETLHAVRDMREIILDDLKRYLDECKRTNDPVSLQYFSVYKELQRTTFEDKSGRR